MKEKRSRGLGLVDFSPSQCGHFLNKNALAQARFINLDEEQITLNALESFVDANLIDEGGAARIIDSCERYPEDILESLYSIAVGGRRQS